jgi:tetratricopeptide (TPR) repeat protein
MSLSFLTFSQSFESKYQDAKNDIEKGNHESAISKLNELAKIEPNNFSLFFDLGTSYHKLGDNENAIENYEKALQRNTTCSECYAKLARIYFDRKNLIKTEEILDNGFRIDNNCAELFYTRGLFYKHKGNIDMAFFDFTKAISINPKNADYFITRANLHIQNMNLQSAYSDISDAIKIVPDNSQYYYYRAFILMNLNILNEALDDINKAIGLKDNIADYYNLKFSILLSGGEVDNALKSVSKSIELNPSDYLAYMNMGDLYFQVGEFEKYCNCYQNAINHISENLEAELNNLKNNHSKFCDKSKFPYYYVRALGEFNNMNYDKCLAFTNEGLQLFNYSSILYNIKGSGLLAKKDYVAAKAAFEKSIEYKNILSDEVINSYSTYLSKPNADIIATSYNIKSYLGIAISELHNHNYDNAFRNINEAILYAEYLDSFEGIECLYNVKAMIYLGKNDFKLAYSELDKAFLANKNNLVTNINLAILKILGVGEYAIEKLEFDYIEDMKSPRIILPNIKVSNPNSTNLLAEAWEQCDLVLNKAPQNAIALLLKAKICILQENSDACIFAKKAINLGLDSALKELEINCE